MRRLSLILLTVLSVAAHAGEHATEARKLKLAYAQKLDALLAKAKSAGDTADVKEIEAMIAEAEGKKSPAEGVLAPIVGAWKRDIDGSIWRFAEDGTGSFNGKDSMTVTYDPEKRRFATVTDSKVNHVMVTSDPDKLNGIYEKAGKVLRFKLERVK